MKTIFVSSTFQDMHFERDAIQELVYPRLNRIARQHGQSISFCDLRWGIDTSELESESGSQKVLDVCLDEIDRCQPPMVVILGDRYGWIPSEKLVQDTADRYHLTLDSLEKSVTALEIEYGALSDSGKLDHTLFYFREIVGDVPSNYRTEDEAQALRIKELKDRIHKLTGGRIQYYTLTWKENGFSGIAEFADMLSFDLQKLLLPEWEQYDRMTPFDRELYTHESYLREKGKMFRGRTELVGQLLSDIRNGRKLMILKGEVGSGKSTLFSHLATQLRRENWQVFPLFSGLTAECVTAFDILKHMVYYLEKELNLPHFDGETPMDLEQAPMGNEWKEKKTTDQPDYIKQWQLRLNSLCNQYQTLGKGLIFMLDAADQLYDDDARDHLIFLPEALSDRIRFIMTCLPELSVSGYTTTAIPAIREDDKRQVIDGILSSHGRELPQEVITRMIALPAADNPLYLSFLVQRLLMMNKSDFDSIHQSGDGMQAITSHLLSVIESCPKSLKDMSAKLMETAAQRMNGPMVYQILNYLALSQHGLRLTDLMSLLDNSFQMLDFAHFISYMSDCFLQREDGRYDFSHKSIREGLLEQCRDSKSLHQNMLKHFAALDPEDDIRKREIIHHAILADDKDFFASYIRSYWNHSDPSYLHYAALNTYHTSLFDEGQWLIGLVKDSSKIDEDAILLDFIAVEYNRVSPGRMTELDTLRRVLLAAKEACETVFHLDQKAEIALVLTHCCNALVNCCRLLDDNGTAYDVQMRKVMLSISFLLNHPTPENRRICANECGLAAKIYLDASFDEDASHVSMKELYDFLCQNIPLRQPPNEAPMDTTYNSAWAVMTYVEQIFLELEEDRPDNKVKSDLASHYRNMATMIQDKNLAGPYYEKTLLLYKELIPEMGEIAYRKQLVEVYNEYIKTLGNLYDKTKIRQLVEKQIQVMEELALKDKSTQFRKELALAHKHLGETLEIEFENDALMEQMPIHYRRAQALLESVAEERGTLWDLQELAGIYDYLLTGDLVDGEEYVSMCLKAITLREQLYERTENVDHLIQLYTLYCLIPDNCPKELASYYQKKAEELHKNLIVNTYRRAYNEILEILRHMEKTYVNMIPKRVIIALYVSCDLDYDFRMTEDIGKEKFLPITLNILSSLYNLYWKWMKSDAQTGDFILQLLAFLSF